jgi:hypothetical protein
MSGEVRLCRTEKRQFDGLEEISTGRPLPNTAAVNLEVRPSRESLDHPIPLIRPHVALFFPG